MLNEVSPKYIFYEYFYAERILRETIRFIFQGEYYSNSFTIIRRQTGNLREYSHSFHRTDTPLKEGFIVKNGQTLIAKYFVYDPTLDFEENIYELFVSGLEEVSSEEVNDNIRIKPPPPNNN